jgi:hypothetical protein
MADCGALSASSGQTVLQSLARTEPDLDLKKEVEQVTTSGLEGPAWRFAWIRSAGITDAA